VSTTEISQSAVDQIAKSRGGGDARMATHYLLDQLPFSRRQTIQENSISLPPHCGNVDHCLISFKGFGSAQTHA